MEFAELNFDFHPRAVRSWLAENGFTLQRQLTVSHYRMGLFKKLVPLRLLVGMDALASLTGNWWQLTPSVFTRSCAAGETPAAAPGEFFACPDCHGGLQDGDGKLACASCRRCWPVVDGIYDFR